MFDSDSEAEVPDSQHQFTINEHYAKAFEYRKEREELDKLKAKYGSDFEEEDLESETDSEDLESEDEDGEELTPAMDAAILRTLAKIKRKDPAIYQPEAKVFEEEKQKTGDTAISKRAPKDKSKPITLRQVALDAVLNPTSRSPSPSPAPITHHEEQRHLRDETIAAFHQAVPGDGDDDDDDLLVPRSKTKDEIELEEEEYRAFLEREVGPDLKNLVTVDADTALRQDDAVEPSSSKKKKKKKSKAAKGDGAPKISKEEEDKEFLMNYILNRGWIDRETKRVPTYRDIVKPSKGKGKAKESKQSDSEASGSGSDSGPGVAHEDLDEDEFEEVAEVFETSYNFRFEEPNAAIIPSFPRTIGSTVRREENPRKEARERKKQRKEEELAKKKEEVKRLKSLKMKEIRSKLEKVGKEGGKDLDRDTALQELDLEGDWDPDAHDRQMSGIYGGDDPDAEVDTEKPSWDDDIDIGDIPMEDFDDLRPSTSGKEKKKKKKKGKKAEETEDGVDMDAMDADVERDDDEEWDGTEEMRKRRLDEYMDEVYGLDINGMVGDMATRFKYVPVQSQNFALTPAEILMATDTELNEFMSIKRYAPYRTDAKKWDSKRNDRLKELKRKIAERMGRAPEDSFVQDGGWSGGANRASEQPVKKRKGKKERMKLKAAAEPEEATQPAQADAEEPSEKNSKRKREEDGAEGAEEATADGAEPGSKKRKRRHKKKSEVAASL
ncbi:hypothetical protein HGRIS_001925 [Hohenbuehelia grisea]|uniref:Kri1-like C-terminal domain-containing protein n=1 Tax=Hohenbuehelia grisea TaxID=104357 RepID=A0ABR3JKN4_9AGAR